MSTLFFSLSKIYFWMYNDISQLWNQLWNKLNEPGRLPHPRQDARRGNIKKPGPGPRR